MSNVQACTSIEMTRETVGAESQPVEIPSVLNTPTGDCNASFLREPDSVGPPQSAISTLKCRKNIVQSAPRTTCDPSTTIVNSKPSPRRRSGRITLNNSESADTPVRKSNDLRQIAIKQDALRKEAANSPKPTPTTSRRRSCRPALPTVVEGQTETGPYPSVEDDKGNHVTKQNKRQLGKGKHKLMVLDAQLPAELTVPSKATNAAQEKPRIFSPVVKRIRSRPGMDKSSESDKSLEKPAEKVRRRSMRIQPEITDEQSDVVNERDNPVIDKDRAVSISVKVPDVVTTTCDNLLQTLSPAGEKKQKYTESRRTSSTVTTESKVSTKPAAAIVKKTAAIKRRQSTAAICTPSQTPAIRPEAPIASSTVEIQDLFSEELASQSKTPKSHRRRSVPVGNWLSDDKWDLSPDNTEKTNCSQTSYGSAMEGRSTAYSVLNLPSSTNSTLLNLTYSRRSTLEFKPIPSKSRKLSKASTSAVKSETASIAESKAKHSAKTIAQEKQNRSKVQGKENRSSTSSSDGDSVTSLSSTKSDRRKWIKVDVSPNVCFTDSNIKRTLVTTSAHTA